VTNEFIIPDKGQPTLAQRPMTCLVVVPSLIRAGAETQAIDLANGLAASGHTIHLCSFEPQLDQRGRISDAVQFHHVRRDWKYDLSLIDRLAQVIDQKRIDVVQGVLQFATLIAWLAAKRSHTKPPVVAAVHTTINRGMKEELQDRLLYSRMLKRLPAVVFVCEHQRRHWIGKYPDLRPTSTVVHNGVDPNRFLRDNFTESATKLRARLGIPEQAFVFAAIAAFRPEKGHRILIDAFAHTSGDSFLVFAGDGDLRQKMESYATEAGLKDRTRFLGNIPDTRPLVAASNATVLASTAVETFSMAMLESMAMRVPMIAPRIGGLPEAIDDRETGLLFPIGDSLALTRCMKFVLHKPSEAERMGRSAERKVTECFSLVQMVHETERVLRRALESVGPEQS
jgi:glycosyltransferase involved in cell wall biosynthesis